MTCCTPKVPRHQDDEHRHALPLARAARALQALQRFWTTSESHDRVWICRRLDIARHWKATHPLTPGPLSYGPEPGGPERGEPGRLRAPARRRLRALALDCRARSRPPTRWWLGPKPSWSERLSRWSREASEAEAPGRGRQKSRPAPGQLRGQSRRRRGVGSAQQRAGNDEWPANRPGPKGWSRKGRSGVAPLVRGYPDGALRPARPLRGPTRAWISPPTP